MRVNVPSGYKQTKVGVIPEDWREFQLKDILNLTLEPLKMEDDKEYELITVRRRFGGVDSRGLFQGKEILVKNQFYVRENDFVISKRQISHGACGLVPKELDGAIVSNEYNVFQPNKTLLNQDFFNYYVRLPKFSQTFYNYSDGIHIEKLLFKTQSWLKQKIPLPPLKEQKKIAQILTTWDDAIIKQEALTKAKEELKKGLMQKLLSGEVRFDGFDGEWKFIRLCDLLEYEQPTPYLVANKDYNDSYTTPVLTAGKTFILGYTKEENGIFKENLPVIIFDDFTTATKFVDFPFKAKSSAMKILKAKTNTINMKLVYEMMQMINYDSEDHKRYWISIYQELEIRFPEKEEQQKIAQVLTLADKEIDLLKNELEALKEQKRGLMQRLLSGGVRVVV